MSGRILFVTGKGGTGKSRVAEALARAAAANGRPAVLLRISPPAVAAPARHLPYREILLDDDRALGDFLTRALRFAFLARRLKDSRTFSAVAAAAPGLRDLVRLTTITHLAASASPRTIVVVDAPATGHSVPLLTAPARVLDLARLGPVEHDARVARETVADPRKFTPVLVTTPEELAIAEVLSLREQLREACTADARIVVNAVWPSHLDEEHHGAFANAALSEDAGTHLRRQRRQAALIGQLESAAGPCARIAYRFDADEDDALAGADIDALFEALTKDTP